MPMCNCVHKMLWFRREWSVLKIRNSIVCAIHDKICISMHQSPQRILSKMHRCLHWIGLNYCIHLNDDTCVLNAVTQWLINTHLLNIRWCFFPCGLRAMQRKSYSCASPAENPYVKCYRFVSRMRRTVWSMGTYVRYDTVVFGTVCFTWHRVFCFADCLAHQPFHRMRHVDQLANQKVWNVTIRLSNQSVCKCMTCCALLFGFNEVKRNTGGME